MPHNFTREECQKGGRVAASLPGFRDIQAKGFEALIERHGRMAGYKIITRACRRRGIPPRKRGC